MRGREVESRQLFDTARAEVIGRGEGAGLSFIDWAESVLYNGLGRYADALAAARRVVGHTELVTSNWAMPELIEAAVRVGAFELAAETDRHLTDRSSASGTDWALGIAARSHALVEDDVMPRTSTLKRSNGSRARESLSTWPVLTYSTASGSDVSVVVWTLGASCESLTRCSPALEWKRLPSEHGLSCRRAAKPR